MILSKTKVTQKLELIELDQLRTENIYQNNGDNHEW